MKNKKNKAETKMYFRVYDSHGNELFASEYLSCCRAFVAQNCDFIEGLVIRKLVYRSIDICALVISNTIIS